VANGYIKSKELCGIQITKRLLQWSVMQGCGPESVLPSFSQALNTYLSLETDDDFFYSILTIASAHALREDVDQYKMDADVSNYFVFTKQGVMALKPGDMLIFIRPALLPTRTKMSFLCRSTARVQLLGRTTTLFL
jgi:hypothetical protein